VKRPYPGRPAFVLTAALALAIVLGSLGGSEPVRDVVTGTAPQSTTLVLPGGYVLLSPVSRLLDAVGLFSADQHTAFLLTVLGASVIWGAIRARPNGRRRLRGGLAAGALALVVLIVVYAAVAALPRPMASLGVSDSSLVRVDFHSHTSASHDTRGSFGAEANRAWHASGGFDAVYVSDHWSVTGAEQGRARNPARAGDGTVLLSAYEGRYRGLFVLFLGLTRADSAVLLGPRRHLLAGTLRSGRTPSTVVAIPGPLEDIRAVARDSAPYVAAVELVDGSPRGLAQGDRDRQAILRRADSLGLARVTGTNNHGWGRVVPGWTLVPLPGWRSLAPDSLAAAIEQTLRDAPRSIQAIERRRVRGTSVASIVLTAPLMMGEVLTALTMGERLVWLVVLAALVIADRAIRRRRAPETP
jgi:hypothetical protein